MHLTMTLAQLVGIFFVVMMSVCMSYVFTVMQMKTPPTYILTFALFAEILTALCAYFAYRLAMQQPDQYLSFLDATVFLAAILLFCMIMSKGPKVWKRTMFKENFL